MKCFLLRLPVLLAAVVALGESTAHADSLSVNFTYHWSVQPIIVGTTGGVQFSLGQPDGTGSYVSGAAMPTVLFGPTVTTSVSPGMTDTYNTSFALKLSLTDTTSGASGDFSFAGKLVGNVTDNALTTTLTSSFSPVKQSLLLGNHTYEVAIDPSPFLLPHAGSDANGLLDALVRVKNKNGGDGGSGGGSGGSGGGGGPTPQPDVPEPSSLVLGGIAVLGLAARRWSRRQRSA